jgi:hypothetical protein
MGTENLPLILVELVLVLGGALAFGWWQLRDLAREKAKRQAKLAAAQPKATDSPSAGAGSTD